MAVDSDIVRRVGEDVRRCTSPISAAKCDSLEGVAAQDTMTAKEPQIADLGDRGSLGIRAAHQRIRRRRPCRFERFDPQSISPSRSRSPRH